MKKYLKNNWKKILKYIIIYILVFLCYQFIFFYLKLSDSTNAFAFGHVIRNGEVIYKDFNTITTPLYAFFVALGLCFYDSFITFVLEQTLLVTLTIYFLEKIIPKKWPLFLTIFLLPLPLFSAVFYMTYNYMTLFFIVILYYLEKAHPDKDYLIGFIIGLAILSKHTIGCLLVIPLVIICFHDKKKLLKRFVGLFIPCIIFLVYLVLSDSLWDFFNLCFLGLFDFKSKNGHLFGVCFYISILLFIFMILFIIRHKNLKYNYYLLCTFFFAYPLFDLYHFSLYFFFFVLMIFSFYDDFCAKYLFKLGLILDILILCLYTFMSLNYKFVSRNYMKYYDTLVLPDFEDSNFSPVFKFLDKYCEDGNCIILNFMNPYYNISNDYGIDYFTVPLRGNHGYDGTNRLIKDLKDDKRNYIVLDARLNVNRNYREQYNYELFDYVIKNYEKIDSWKCFDVYLKK